MDMSLEGMLAFTPFNYELLLGFLLLAPLTFVALRKRWTSEDMLFFAICALILIGTVLAFMEGSGDGLGVVVFTGSAFVLWMKCSGYMARNGYFPSIQGPPAPPPEPPAQVRATSQPNPDLSATPGYDPHLAARIEAAWPRLQKAWENQNLDPVRSFLSDGMQVRTQIQLNALKRRGIRNALQNAKVRHVELAEIVEGSSFTTCTARIRAEGCDVEIDVETGERRVQGGGNQPFTEYWTFMKRTGVKPSGAGLLEGNCPSCGTPLEIGATTVCPSCRSKVKSGAFDWVLTEITQSSVWNARAAYSQRIVQELVARDPGFTVHGIEDHACMLFWKMVQSIAEEKTVPSLQLHLSPDVLQKSTRAWSSIKRGEWFHLEPVVASVELESWEELRLRDRLEIRIRWQLGPKTRLSRPIPVDPISTGMATLFKKLATRPGIPEFNPAQMQASGRDGLEEDRKSIFVFERPLGQETPDDRNLTTAHCPSCGGPDTPETGAVCTWCGTSLADQAGAWALVEIKPGHKAFGI